MQTFSKSQTQPLGESCCALEFPENVRLDFTCKRFIWIRPDSKLEDVEGQGFHLWSEATDALFSFVLGNWNFDPALCCCGVTKSPCGIMWQTCGVWENLTTAGPKDLTFLPFGAPAPLKGLISTTNCFEAFLLSELQCSNTKSGAVFRKKRWILDDFWIATFPKCTAGKELKS